MLGSRQKLKYEVVEKVADDEEVDLEAVKRNVFTPPCFWASLITTLLIATYFIPSIGLTFYQRWLYKKFHFPLITVLIHMVVKLFLATLIRFFMYCNHPRPRAIDFVEYVTSIAPTGVFSGFDISFSNWGLELINVSLYTMTKSTTIVFILGFAIIFKLEKKSWSLCTIVIMISVGLILFTYKATEFNVLGFTLVLVASISSGLRWTSVQLLLQKSKIGIRNPVDMIFHMQPWMIASLLPLALIMEGPKFQSTMLQIETAEFNEFLRKVLTGALIAFFMELSEVLVVTYTSSLTLSIAGIFKEVIILVLAVEWNGDQMSVINQLGLLICLCGITSHVIHKIKTTSMYNVKPYDFAEKSELGESLIQEGTRKPSLSSESEQSDSEELFNILNRHDR